MHANKRRTRHLKYLGMVILLFFSFPISAARQDTRVAELEYSNKKLNAIYKKLMAQLVPEEQNKLKKAQRQWIIFRDLECVWVETIPLDCLIDRTGSRTTELQEDLSLRLRHNSTIVMNPNSPITH